MKIESFTKAQEDRMPYYVDTWRAIGLSTAPCNMEQCESIVASVYKEGGLAEPQYKLGPFNNPIEAAYAETLVDTYCDGKHTSDEANKIILEMTEKYFQNPNPVLEGLSCSNQIYGSMEASWLSFYDFFRRECGDTDCNPLIPLSELAKVCGWWTPLENAALFQHRPKALHFDDQRLAHNENGPAIEFRGSPHCNVYAIHGVIVHKNVVEGNFNVKDIESETNVEVRRVMIDIYGKERFIIDSGAVEMSSDDFGTLYKKELPNDEPILMVKVVNSTVEPDGSYKDYWIRVDPNVYGGITTARAAVASTWRNDDGSLVFSSPEEYDPQVET